MLMRRLLLIRHAKSSWKFPELSDHDRPLNRRGRRDAKAMSFWLAAREEPLETVFTSSAVRALKFAERLSNECQTSLRIEPDLYTFNAQLILDFVQNLPNSLRCVALVGHNPAIEDSIGQLTHQWFDKVPTSSIAAIDWPTEDWSTTSADLGRLDYFVYPKMLNQL